MEHRQTIKNLFHEAVELAPLERKNFLDAGCDDLTVRREVESLLAAHDEAANFIDSPAYLEADFSGSNVDEDSPDETPERIGETVGSYEIVREIGRGGMGTVYLAHRADGDFRQEVAVKIVKRGMDTDFVVKRFRQERQILASLNHPNIARLFEGGTTNDGLPYFVMEFVAGQDLMKFAAEHDLSIVERLNLFRQICAAVAYAHQNLVVHRDLKPSNILVTPEKVPKLLDFGIAKLLVSDSHDAADTTGVYRLLTPQYASPEQIRGTAITTASDVYSLGVCLYELLSGQHPFRRKQYTPHEWMQAVCEKEPTKPSLATAEAQNPETQNDKKPKSKIHNLKLLQGDLDNIVLKALHKEPLRRYAAAADLSEDIRRYLSGLPVSARPDTVSYRVGKFARRHRISVSATAMFVLLLLVTATFAVRQAVRADAERANAQKRFDDVRALANSLMFEVHDSIKDLSGATAARQLIINRSVQYLDKLAQESAADPTLQAELAAGYERIGDVQGNPFLSNAGDTTGAIESYQKSLAIRESLAKNAAADSSESFLSAFLHSKLAQIRVTRNELTEAETHCRQALAIVAKLLAAEPSDPQNQVAAAKFHLQLGDILSAKKDAETDSASDNYLKSIALAEVVSATEATKRQTGGELPPAEKAFDILQMAHRRIGQKMESNGQTEAALSAYLKSLAASEKLVAANEQKTHYKIVHSIALGNVGRLQASLGNFDEAFTKTRRMVEISENLAANDPQNKLAVSQFSLSLGSLGYVYDQSGDFSNALLNLEKSRQIQQQLREKDSSDVYNIGNLGETIAYIGIVHEKIAAAPQTAAAIRRQHLIAAEKMFQESLNIWLELEKNNKLPQYFAGKIVEQNQAIARCRKSLTEK